MSTPPHTPPSIHDGIRGDEGGPLARKGFAFQDHVAVRCCLVMLESSDISEVWCETYDDVVSLKQGIDGEVGSAEYIQVKSLEINQLWTVAKLCAREGGKVGSSLLEQSLARDRFKEVARFKLVTSLPLHSGLRILQLPLAHPDRAIATPDFNELSTELSQKFLGTAFGNGKDIPYWLANTVWEHFSPTSLPDENVGKMHKALDGLGYTPDPATCQEVYQRFLTILKEAAELPWSEREGRKFCRQRVIDVLRALADPHPNLGSTQKLTAKILATSLDSSYASTAMGMRTAFRQRFRDSRVMEEMKRSELEAAVLSRLQSLRLQFDSGELRDTPSQFYARCVQEMRTLNSEPSFEKMNLPEGFFEGCMYEVTGRCAHRFVKGVA